MRRFRVYRLRHLVLGLIFLTLVASASVLQVRALIEPVSLTLTVVGIGTIVVPLLAYELSTLVSTLGQSSYSVLFPQPILDPNAPALKKWEKTMRPYTIDTGRDLFKDLKDAKDKADKAKRIAQIINDYLESRKAGVSESLCSYDSSGYYLCVTERRNKNGFEETWLKWAKWPKETVSMALIGMKDVTAPSVRVTSPNGRESWEAGEVRSIEWTASDNHRVNRIDIFYSTNNGRSWQIITTGSSNAGSHSWRIPNTPSSDCLIKVVAYDAAGNSGSDTSDRAFTIRARAFSLTVVVKDLKTGSAVAGASVYLDGLYKGSTDRNGRLVISNVAQGSHTVKVTKSGYNDGSQSVNLQSDTSITVYLTPISKTFSLTVVVKDLKTGSAVAGASVYLDGSYKGTTDSNGRLVISNVSEGSHIVRASKSGYYDKSQTVAVSSNTSVTISLTRR